MFEATGCVGAHDELFENADSLDAVTGGSTDGLNVQVSRIAGGVDGE